MINNVKHDCRLQNYIQAFQKCKYLYFSFFFFHVTDDFSSGVIYTVFSIITTACRILEIIQGIKLFPMGIYATCKENIGP